MNGLTWLLLAVNTLTVLVGSYLIRPDGTGRRPFLSAYSLVLWLFCLYALLPTVLIALNSGRFVWAPTPATPDALNGTEFLIFVALLSFIFGNKAAGALIDKYSESHRLSVLHPARESLTPARSEIRAVKLAYVLLIAGLALKVYLTLSTGGFEAAVIRASGSASAYAGLDRFGASAIALRTVSGIADIGAVWILVDALRTKRRIVVPIGLFALTMTLSYTLAGKRLSLLLPVLVVALAIHVLRRPIAASAFPLLLAAAAGFGMASLLLRIFLPASAAGIEINLNAVEYAGGSIFAFYFYSLEFSTVEMLTVAQTNTDQVYALFGGAPNTFVETNLIPFLYTIPSAVWPDKPSQIFDLSYAMSSAVLGQPVEDSTVGYVTTIIGNSFVTAGTAGVVIFITCFGAWTAMIDRWFWASGITTQRIVGYAILLTITFHLFRMGTVAWTFIIAVVQQYGVLVGFLALIVTLKLGQAKRRAPHVGVFAR